ncbi:hypothetical protein B0H19DRAFT_1074176 [Mycena capillaripes]|nr:hypothetical protein B0H19DRAFT_1074176 [Mycena capillaripes]
MASVGALPIKCHEPTVMALAGTCPTSQVWLEVYQTPDTTSWDEDPIYYAVKCMRNDAPGSKRVAALRNKFTRSYWIPALLHGCNIPGYYSSAKSGDISLWGWHRTTAAVTNATTHTPSSDQPLLGDPAVAFHLALNGSHVNPPFLVSFGLCLLTMYMSNCD